jgi:hypothetical protein
LTAGGAVKRGAVGDKRVGTGDTRAVHGDAHVRLIETADARTTADAIDVFHIDAREKFEEFTDVALAAVAEAVGRDGGRDVHVAPLLHDGLGVALALGGDDELADQHDLILARGLGERAHQFEIARDRRAGRHRDGRTGRLVAGERHLERGAARRHVVELVDAALLGVDGVLRALHPDLGVAHVFTGAGVKNPADHTARRSRLREDGRRETDRG